MESNTRDMAKESGGDKVKHLTIDNANIVCPKGMAQKEVKEYIKHLKDKHPKQRPVRLKISVDGEYVDIEYELAPVPFERIRRITGYLVGTTDRWNNAKQAEEKARVKHSTEE